MMHVSRRFLKQTGLLLIGLLISVFVSACHEDPPVPEEEVEEKIDIPLCDSLRITVEQIVNRYVGDLLYKADDGAYYYVTEPDSLHLDVYSIQIPDSTFTFEAYNDIELPLFSFSDQEAAAVSEPYDVYWSNQEMAYAIQGIRFPPEITQFMDIYLEDTYLSVTVSLPRDRILSGTLRADLALVDGTEYPFPGLLFQDMVFSEETGYSCVKEFPVGLLDVTRLPAYDASSATFLGNSRITFWATVQSSDLVISQDVGFLVHFELVHPCIQSVSALFEFPEQRVHYAYSTAPIPDLLQKLDAYLDFQKPQISLEMRSNLNTPYLAHVQMSAWKGGAALPGDLDFSLFIPYSVYQRFISSQKSVIGPGNRQAFDVDVKLTSVLGPVPDSVICDLRLYATQKGGIVYRGEPAWLDIKPSVYIPIAFDDAFSMTFREMIGSLLTLHETMPVVEGTVENRTPITGGFSVILIDRMGDTVASTETIEFGRNAKKEVKLEFSLQEGRSLKEAIRAVIVWHAHSRNHYALRATDYVEYSLNLHT